MKKRVSPQTDTDILTAKRRAIVARNRKAWVSRKRMKRAREQAERDGRSEGS